MSTTTIYRAAWQNSLDFGECAASEREHAEAYLDWRGTNSEHGSAPARKLFAFKATGSVLDLRGDWKARLAELGISAADSHCCANEWLLAADGIMEIDADWVIFDDDYQDGAETWLRVSTSAIEGIELQNA